jgi:hypothetical protein
LKPITRRDDRQDAKDARRKPKSPAHLASLASWRFLLLFSCCASCGYQPVYGRDALRLHVKLVRTVVPYAVASDEVVAAVREELALAGAISPGEGFPRLEIEVLRVDEASEGIAAGTSGPVARASSVAVVARGWIVRDPGGEPESDTGDLRAQESVAIDQVGGAPDPRAGGLHRESAVRAAARRLGRKLARRISGLPVANED